jgi:hypothetical protein
MKQIILIRNGDIRNNLGPLTHMNLPLALFLESNEFTGSSFRVNAWTGSRTSYASDNDIIRQLGIGYIRYSPAPNIETAPATT